MTVWVEGEHSFFLGAKASLIEDNHEVAANWASDFVVPNPAYSWILGRFVESDKANNNRQLFSLKGLQMAKPSIQHAPMNMNHSNRRVVGAFVASELLYPTVPDGEEAAESASLNPYIESLAVVWKHYFPDEYVEIARAHHEGALYYSMECVPSHVQCTGEGGCEETFEYAGRISPTYCEHLNKTTSDKYLINPWFTAGACIVPPVRPGWANADVHSLVSRQVELAERIHDGIADEMPHLSAAEWEGLMTEFMALVAEKN
jgi:hypothetical protein